VMDIIQGGERNIASLLEFRRTENQHFGGSTGIKMRSASARADAGHSSAMTDYCPINVLFFTSTCTIVTSL